METNRNPYRASPERRPGSPYRSDFSATNAIKNVMGVKSEIPDSQKFASPYRAEPSMEQPSSSYGTNLARGPQQSSGYAPSISASMPTPQAQPRSGMTRPGYTTGNVESSVSSPITSRQPYGTVNPGATQRPISNAYGDMTRNYYNNTQPRINSVQSRAEGAREFRSAGGNFTRMGHFTGVDKDGTVHIRSASTGSDIPVPYSKLSAEDQKYIKGIVRPENKAAGRVFTSADGKHARQGEFAGMDNNGNVQIRMQDGRITRVGYSQLSPGDQKFIRSIGTGRDKQSPAESIGAIRGNDSYSTIPAYSNIPGTNEINNRTGQTRFMESAQANGRADADAFIENYRAQPGFSYTGAPGTSERTRNEAEFFRNSAARLQNERMQKEKAYDDGWNKWKAARDAESPVKYGAFITQNWDKIPAWMKDNAAQRNVPVATVFGEWVSRNGGRDSDWTNVDPLVQAWNDQRADELHGG